MTREQILAEIKRTAAENGGVPVGVRRFYNETGINQSAWAGKYWLRWSEALNEAGFRPNTFTKGYSDDDLLERLALMTRDLGHVPTKLQLRMKAQTDTGFPSEKVFRRFGGKLAVTHRLGEYSKTRRYDDVVAICGHQPPEAEAPRVKAKVPNEDDGFVYLIKFGNYYKIGRTNALGRRERELAIQLPEKTRLVHSIRTDDPSGIEEYWHKRFTAKRGNGEWFELSAGDISAFRWRKFM